MFYGHPDRPGELRIFSFSAFQVRGNFLTPLLLLERVFFLNHTSPLFLRPDRLSQLRRLFYTSQDAYHVNIPVVHVEAL
jgi:hypothetical protein